MTNLYAEYTKEAFEIMKSQGGEAGAFYDAFKRTFTVNNNQLEVDITREKFASVMAENDDGRVFFYKLMALNRGGLFAGVATESDQRRGSVTITQECARHYAGGAR